MRCARRCLAFFTLFDLFAVRIYIRFFFLLLLPCQPTQPAKSRSRRHRDCHPHGVVQRLVLDVGAISSLICAKTVYQMAIDFSMILWWLPSYNSVWVSAVGIDLVKCSMTTSLTLKYMRLTGVEVKPIIMVMDGYGIYYEMLIFGGTLNNEWIICK